MLAFSANAQSNWVILCHMLGRTHTPHRKLWNARRASTETLAARFISPTGCQSRFTKGAITTLFISFSLGLSPSLADQQLSGTLSGKLTASKGPYLLIGNCTVPSDASLVVEAGTTLIVGPSVNLNISGGAQFDGTAASPIFIRGSSSNAYWDSVYVANPTGKAQRFSYCTFQDATNGLSLLVAENTMTLNIRNCVFENCLKAGISGISQGTIYGRGIGQSCVWTAPKLNAVVANCTFGRCKYGCIFTTTGLYQNCNSLYPGLAPGAASPIIKNSIFREITGTAIWFQSLVNSAVSFPTVENNTVLNCANGVTAESSFNGALLNNIFVSNITAISRTSTNSSRVSNNDFFGNERNYSGYAGSPLGIITTTNNAGVPSDVALNIYQDPHFTSSENLRLSIGSPAIDAGVDDAANYESCFPSARGSQLPDIGAFGGSSSCGWPIPSTSTKEVPFEIALAVELSFNSEKGARYSVVMAAPWPDVNTTNRTITFRLQAPNAKSVRVITDMPKVGDLPHGSGGFDMTKDEKGVWSHTTPPLKPSYYQYWFVMDGLTMPDPQNTFVRPASGVYKSIVALPGKEADFMMFRDVPHGNLTEHHYLNQENKTLAVLSSTRHPTTARAARAIPSFTSCTGPTITNAAGRRRAWRTRSWIILSLKVKRCRRSS